MKLLLVGDVHATVESLEDCWRLMEFVGQKAEEHKPDYVVFLGDQYDDHAIVNVQVQRFWLDVFTGLSCKTIALVGNHDRPNDTSVVAHSMQVHKEQILVIDRPIPVGGVLFCPYYADPAQLVEVCKSNFPYIPMVVCHQTFQGAQYENGFYAKDALDSNLLPQEIIISGHIHTPARFGKIWYPGSPRWLTWADANINRFIYLFDTETKEIQGWPTRKTCRVLYKVNDDPMSNSQVWLNAAGVKPQDKVKVTVGGPKDWVEQRAAELGACGYLVNTIETRPIEEYAVRESQGIETAFQKYFEAFNPPCNTPKEVLQKRVESCLTR